MTETQKLQKAAKNHKLLRYYETEDSDGWESVKAVHLAKDSTENDLIETWDGELYTLNSARLEITE